MKQVLFYFTYVCIQIYYIGNFWWRGQDWCVCVPVWTFCCISCRCITHCLIWRNRLNAACFWICRFPSPSTPNLGSSTLFSTSIILHGKFAFFPPSLCKAFNLVFIETAMLLFIPLLFNWFLKCLF